MAYRLACSDAGYECSFVAEGETIEQVLNKGADHAREIHGFTEDQLRDPAMRSQLRAAVKQNW
jgi:predicted small metal-binding protein